MDEDVRLFIGPNSRYFMKKWSEVDYIKRINTWNWAGFLFSFAWLAYRRMYSYCFILMALFLFSLFMVEVMGLSATFYIAAGLFFPLMIGYFGNNMYRYYVGGQINSIYGMQIEGPKLKRYLVSAGGVDLGAGVVSVIALVLLIYLMSWWLNMAPAPYLPESLIEVLEP